MNDTIEFSKKLGYPEIFRDFVSNSDKLNGFFKKPSISDLINEIDTHPYNRSLIYEILKKQNLDWGAPSQVIENIESVKNKGSLMVFAGQQACLLGGPYMILLKILTVVYEAKRLSKETGRDIIPIFWIAADDHDFTEIATANIFDRSGQLQKLQLHVDAEKTYPPVGALGLNIDITDVLNSLEKSLGGFDNFNALKDVIDGIFQPGRNIVDAFAELMLHLVGHLGVVFFNPYDEKFKAIVSGFVEKILTDHDKIAEGINKQNTSLKASGYHLQVEKADSAAFLFHHQPGRVAIHTKGDKFIAGKRKFTLDALAKLIKKQPLAFSPDALTRPLVQSYFFPVIETIGGPAEIAYWIQMARLYELFEIPRPVIASRASATVIEPYMARFMENHNIDYEEAVIDIEAVINQRLNDSFPDEIATVIPLFNQITQDNLKSVKDRLLDFDAGLEGMIDKAAGNIDRELNKLDKKIFATHKKKHEAERKKYYILRDNLYPDSIAAERWILTLYFIARYGRGWIDWLYDNLEFDQNHHQLVDMTDYNG